MSTWNPHRRQPLKARQTPVGPLPAHDSALGDGTCTPNGQYLCHVQAKQPGTWPKLLRDALPSQGGRRPKPQSTSSPHDTRPAPMLAS